MSKSFRLEPDSPKSTKYIYLLGIITEIVVFWGIITYFGVTPVTVGSFLLITAILIWSNMSLKTPKKRK